MSMQTTDTPLTESPSATPVSEAAETADVSIKPVLFSPGQVVATPGAIAAMEANQCLPLDLLQRHLTGDYGVLDPEDVQANREALVHGLRLLSNYPLADGQRIWIITEAERSVTTFLLPEDY